MHINSLLYIHVCVHVHVVPEEFDYNSQTGRHGDRSQRMEIKRSSVEYIAPSEYMVSGNYGMMYTDQ